MSHSTTVSAARRRAVPAGLAAVLAALLAVVLTPHAARAATPPVAVPSDGSAYFGVNLGDPLDVYVQRSGLRPAVVGHFAELPLTTTTKQSLSAAVDAARAGNSRLFLTLEPMSGLGSLTDAVAQDVAATLADYNARGVEVLVRFAHEMNGAWYPWGQQPAAYVAAFARLATAVHATAPRTAMAWAPNYGGGYPYTGGTYAARTGTADFAALDTNRDGRLTMADDPYAPYYPGDAHVDWVGLTAYHFGHAWPYGENEVPEANKFAQQLRGAYTGNGLYEDQSALPDFYGDFAVGHGKPMVVAETGALYNETPPSPGATEVAVKTAWIDQVYAASTRAAFPQIKMINWFEHRKFESETKSTVDWRATTNPAVLDRLRAHVTTAAYLFAGGTTPGPTTGVAPSAPTALSGYSANSPTRVTLTWSPPTSTGGSPVTGYVVCRTDTNTCTTLSASTRTTTFSPLQRKTSYGFTVRALNEVGPSPAASVTVRTK